MVRSHATMPPPLPPSAMVWLPDRIGYRPVINAERVGVHCGSTTKCDSFSDSAAKASIRTVSAPRRMPPP